MDQKKIGIFIKELRKEKGITQEQLAEHLGVAGRTVSRWETGSNMPDISLLVELSDFFEVSIPEIIDGKRRCATDVQQIKAVADALTDYATAEKETMITDIQRYSIIGILAMAVYALLSLHDITVAIYFSTLCFVSMLLIFTHTTGVLIKLRKKYSNVESKTIPAVVKYIVAAVVAFAGSLLINLLTGGSWG